MKRIKIALLAFAALSLLVILNMGCASTTTVQTSMIYAVFGNPGSDTSTSKTISTTATIHKSSNDSTPTPDTSAAASKTVNPNPTPAASTPCSGAGICESSPGATAIPNAIAVIFNLMQTGQTYSLVMSFKLGDLSAQQKPSVSLFSAQASYPLNAASIKNLTTNIPWLSSYTVTGAGTVANDGTTVTVTFPATMP